MWWNKAINEILSEQTPCEGCVHNDRCATQKEACFAFALYVNTGAVNWEIPRKPTRRTYARLMWFNDSNLVRDINKQLRKLENV